MYFANAELRNASQENEEGHFSLLLRLFILRDGFPEGRFQPNKKYPVIIHIITGFAIKTFEYLTIRYQRLVEFSEGHLHIATWYDRNRFKLISTYSKSPGNAYSENPFVPMAFLLIKSTKFNFHPAWYLLE